MDRGKSDLARGAPRFRSRARTPGSVGTLVAVALVAWLLGCVTRSPSIPDPEQRRQSAESLARQAGFRKIEIDPVEERVLPIATWLRPGRPNAALHVYIEGDGVAWRSRRRISEDPTPVEPIGLALAIADPTDANVLYLGRPCQYGFSDESLCRPFLWTAARFGETMIDAMDRRLSRLRDAPGLARGPLHLIGYSGGGVVATLLAARRHDVDQLVTVAAPLDIDTWTRRAGVSRLAASLSPMDHLEELRGLQQIHFAGRDDTRVPLAATESFLRALEPDTTSRLLIIDEMDHRAWPSRWRAIVTEHRLFDE